MKKVLSFVVSVIILIVSCIPCEDSKAYTSNGADKVVISLGSDQTNADTDVCSPFCQCNCCSGFSINYFPQTDFTTFIRYHQIYPGLSSTSIANMASAIWQPPQLKERA